MSEKESKRSGSPRRSQAAGKKAATVGSPSAKPGSGGGPDKDFNFGQYLTDMRTLQKAHQIIVKKSAVYQLQAEASSDPEHKPEHEYNDFINYTTVRELFDEVTAPLLAELPRLKQDIAYNHSNFLGLQGQLTARQGTDLAVQEELREIGEVKQTQETHKSLIDALNDSEAETNERMETQFTRVRNELIKT